MRKDLTNAGVGFLVGGGLTFVVVYSLFAGADNDAFTPFALVLGVPAGLVAGVIGALVGVAIGSVEEQIGSSRSRNCCRRCGSRLSDNSETSKWCGEERPLG
jgi:hypothetical protein